MATDPVLQQVSVEEYERTPALFERHEYVEGRLIQKALPTRKHSLLQGWLSHLFYLHFPGLVHGPELHSKLRTATWRIPDFAVQALDVARDEKYAYAPLLLAIEIRSPDYRWSDVLAKFEEYHDWGVPFCWLLDPENQRAWTFHQGGDLEEVTTDSFIEAGEIRLAVPELFSVLHEK